MDLRTLRLLGSMCWFEAQRFRAFPLEIIASILATIAETTLYIVFWLLISRLSGRGDVDAKEIVSFYLIITGLTPFFYASLNVASQTIKLIKSGELNQILIKPVNPVFYPVAMRTGRNIINYALGLLQVIVGVVIIGGISTSSLPFLIPVLFNTVVINVAFNIMVGTAGFYMTDAGGIKNTFMHVARLCKGESIPLFMMPVSVATALQFTPFPASMYHLTILLQGNRLPDWGFVLIGTVWGVVLMYVAIKFWNHGLKKYEAIGI